VVVDDEADEDERGHARDHGEEGLHLGRHAPAVREDTVLDEYRANLAP
jgi:hypothetical protein